MEPLDVGDPVLQLVADAGDALVGIVQHAPGVQGDVTGNVVADARRRRERLEVGIRALEMRQGALIADLQSHLTELRIVTE